MNYLEKLQALPEIQKKLILFGVVALVAVALGYWWLTSAIDTWSRINLSEAVSGNQ